MTADQCYICNEEITGNFCAEFEGKIKPVCRDCAEGITNGLEILREVGVIAEKQDR